MGIHSQSKVSDYWNRDSVKGPLHPLVYDYIGLCRWEQIDRFLRISKPTSSTSTVFEKLEELSEHLRHAFKQYWTIRTHLAVDCQDPDPAKDRTQTPHQRCLPIGSGSTSLKVLSAISRIASSRTAI